MTTRSYETEVYASPGDGGTVRGIKVNLCGCPCSAQDTFRCPSFMTLWECHLCESQGYYLPQCQPYQMRHWEMRHFYRSGGKCPDPRDFWFMRRALLEQAKDSRAQAAKLKESAKKSLERARLRKKKADESTKELLSRARLYEKEAWAIPMQQTCKVSDGC